MSARYRYPNLWVVVIWLFETHTNMVFRLICPTLNCHETTSVCILRVTALYSLVNLYPAPPCKLTNFKTSCRVTQTAPGQYNMGLIHVSPCKCLHVPDSPLPDSGFEGSEWASWAVLICRGGAPDIIYKGITMTHQTSYGICISIARSQHTITS